MTKTEKNESGDEQMHLLDKKFHSASVNRIGICVRKPLLVTVSSDRSVRVWNIETGEMEIYKEFNEEAYGVAFHPSVMCGGIAGLKRDDGGEEYEEEDEEKEQRESEKKKNQKQKKKKTRRGRKKEEEEN